MLLILIFLLFGSYQILMHIFKDVNLVYFIQHAIFNVHLVIQIFPDLIQTIRDPLACGIGWTSAYPIVSILVFHIYHILISKKLKMDEWFHHIFFCCIMPPILILLAPYNLTNASLVFFSGIPGAVSYTLLSLVKLGKVTKLFEKRISSFLYLWIRMPALIIFAFLLLVHLVNCPGNNTPLNTVLALIGSAGIYWNGIYYGDAYSQSYNRLLTHKN